MHKCVESGMTVSRPSFDYLRLHEQRRSEKFCDVHLQSSKEDTKKLIPCHKIILSINSKYFERELSKDPNSKHLNIPAVDHETLELLVECIYGRHIELTEENVSKIHVGAEKLELHGLLACCIEFVNITISVKNVSKLLTSSLNCECKLMVEVCMRFIIQYFPDVRPFLSLNLDLEAIQQLMAHELILRSVTSEDILELVVDWLRGHEDDREANAEILLNKIPVLRIKKFQQLLKDNQFLNNIRTAKNIFVRTAIKLAIAFEEQQEFSAVPASKQSRLDLKHKLTNTSAVHPGHSSNKKRRASTNSNGSTNSTNSDVTVATDKIIRIKSNNNIDITTQPCVPKNASTTPVIAFANFVNGSWKLVLMDLQSKSIKSSWEVKYFKKGTRFCCHNDKIYVVGSTDRNGKGTNVAVFDLQSQRWLARYASTMCNSRSEFQSVILDDNLYVINGRDDGFAMNAVERMNLSRKSTSPLRWVKVRPTHYYRHSFGAVAVDEGIYALGGLAAVHNEEAKPSDSIEFYDPKTNEWHIHKTPMPTKRHSFAVAVLNSKLYVIGGIDDNHRKLSSVDIYDLEIKSWSKGVEMLRPRQNFSAVVLNNCIYAIGGDSESSPTLEKFDLAEGAWDDEGGLPCQHGNYTNVTLFLHKNC